MLIPKLQRGVAEYLAHGNSGKAQMGDEDGDGAVSSGVHSRKAKKLQNKLMRKFVNKPARR